LNQEKPDTITSSMWQDLPGVICHRLESCIVSVNADGSEEKMYRYTTSCPSAPPVSVDSTARTISAS